MKVTHIFSFSKYLSLYKLDFNTKYSHYLGIISEVPCIFFVMMCIVWALAKESAMSRNQIEPPSMWLKYVF